ncbi:MAG: hypothetical protein ACYDCN_13185 [Bacteroidia bacterium]
MGANTIAQNIVFSLADAIKRKIKNKTGCLLLKILSFDDSWARL